MENTNQQIPADHEHEWKEITSNPLANPMTNVCVYCGWLMDLMTGRTVPPNQGMVGIILTDGEATDS
jgi:hypothetical protein